MAHHLLDKLDVVGAFTEPRAECVSHVMYAKMRQQFRLTIFQFSLIHFFGVVGDGDTLDGPVDIMGTEKVTFPIPKKETVIPIHHKVFRIDHIFQELYAVPEQIKIPYFRIKVLELLLYLDALELPKDAEKPYFYKSQVEKVKAIHRLLTGELERHYTIAELSEWFSVPATALKECFKSIYGQPINTYIKQ